MPEMDYNFYGSVIHSLLGQFFKMNFKSPDSFTKKGYFQWHLELNNLAEEGKSVLFRREEKIGRYLSKMKLLLPKFYEENIHEKRKDDVVESRFKVFIETPNFLIQVTGSRDWVRESENSLVVRDYKTGRYRGTEFELEQNPQFGVYSFATEKETGKRPVIEAYYPGLHIHEDSRPVADQYKLEETPTIRETCEFTHEDHLTVKDMILDGVDKIISLRQKLAGEKRIEPVYGEHCRRCPHSYSGACDLYTGANKFPEVRGVKLTGIAKNQGGNHSVVAFKKARKPRIINQLSMEFGP